MSDRQSTALDKFFEQVALRGTREEFVSLVDGPCCEWLGSRINFGSGGLRKDGERPRTLLKVPYGIFQDTTAHRWIYKTVVCPTIGRRIQVHHRCENRLCVRPSHLEAKGQK